MSQKARLLFGLIPVVAWMLSNLPKTILGEFPDCDCGLYQGTVSHIVYGCPNFDAIRKEYFDENFLSLGLLDLAVHLKAKTGLQKIVSSVLSKSLHVP
ncbi:hypothetical protein AVEN_32090-1 [Araneus ventricosus]|uniref:Reverse transcriptase zinc-binding domain-containing protein n=1 Tax=Araneus ventricosus TaxID=182803 RepID=A0A4Y2ED46_ARAVE|nr:hypothetical protein AVEN_32090-1 [Araneus ventricosus]